MRKFLLALPAALILIKGSWGACGDTTVNITANPYNTASLSTAIANCDDSSMVITLKNATGSGGVDTIRFTNEIIVDSRPAGASAVTHIRGEGRDAGSAFIVSENTSTDPMVFDFRANNRGILQNFNIVRKVNNDANHSVSIAASGTIVRDCHFYRVDNGSQAAGSLLSINTSDVLVERCLFRTPPNGKGRAIAIFASGSATRNEYRANIFYGTGLYMTGGSFHIFANTFAGSRDDFNAIIIGSGLTGANTTDRAVNIQHNLFAFKADTLSPIFFGSSTLTASDSILKNAWSRSKANMPLATNGALASVTLNNTAGSNANVVLPRGFSRYAPHVAEFKEYPMVTMRSDENLPRNHADFGRIPRIFNNTISHWTTMPDIASGLPNSKLYFSGANAFSPFIQGKAWSADGAGIKVGALVDMDSRITTPSPLDSGAIGKGVTIVRHPTDSTKMRVSTLAFNTAYYDTLIPPSEMMFFYSNSQGKLAANDSTALKNATTGTPYYSRRSYVGFDNDLIVPKEVRTGNPIFVKVLHYNGGGQAPVLSSGAIAQVTGIPSFPINDLGVPALDGTSDTTRGLFVMTVAKQGSEAIDSVTVTALRAGGGTEQVLTRRAPVQGASATFNFDLPKGSFQFTATPSARVGTTTQTGSATAPTRAYNSRQVVGDTVYVVNKASCAGATGGSDLPFCTLDAALAEIAVKKGGTILVRNGATPLPFQEITIGGADTSAVIITVPMSAGAFDPVHRASFRGSIGKEALIINRKNVTVKGFFIEMPPGSSGTALSVQSGATGVSVDGCVFRPLSNAPASGPAVNIETAGNGDMRFVNNLIWGFGAAVRINTASTGVRVMHNTFIEESTHASPATGILAPGAGLGAVIANNYFSGITTPYDATVAGKAPKLDHNAYQSRSPNLQGHSEVGTVDSVPRLSSLDLTKATWKDDFKGAMDNIIECSLVKQCFELYAGSSTDTYNTAITSDVFGKARLGRTEVGAMEADASTSSVRGVLTMDARPLEVNAPAADDRLVFTVSRRTFDPADAESVYVWWSTGAGADLDDKIPKSNQIAYGINRLGSGSFTDTAVGLEQNESYYIAATLGRNPTKLPNGRILGYGSRGLAKTRTTITGDDCQFGPGKPVCPKNGYFVTDPRFQTRVDFGLPDTGFVKVPEFNFPGPTTYANGKVEINSPMPVIKLSLEAALTKVEGSKQSWKASIRLMEPPGAILDQKELFILPKDASSLPTYVPTWQLRKEGEDFWLDIEGTQSGTFDYGFGNFASALDPGTVSVAQPTPPVFSFKTTKAESASVQLQIGGTGFATANPLIIVTPIPAGGTYANPFDGRYPNKSLMVSAGLAGLEDSLRRERFYRYYQKAVSVDSVTQASKPPAGTHKAFRLAPTDADVFANTTLLESPVNLAISGAGEAVEATLTIPIWTKFKDPELYPDRIGRASRSIEVVFTTFDGAKISRSSGFIRTEFEDANLHTTEKHEFGANTWNLFTYPWDEADSGSLARIVEQTTWNKDERKLMKYKGSGNGASAFIVYDGTDGTGITFDAGRAAWSGSRGFYQPVALSGSSLDYQTYSLPLAAGQWNDFGLPFNFPIKWRDVLNASGMDSTAITVWRYTPGENGQGSWKALSAGSSVVHPWQGLTVKPAAAGTLKFPVLDSSRSATVTVPAKKGSGMQWSAEIRAYNATAQMNLRIGKAGSERVISEAPDVPGQDFRVGLKRLRPDGSEALSEYIQAGTDWRGHWSLAGWSSKSGIRLKVGENGKQTPLYLVETLARKTVALVPGAEAVLSEEDLKTGDYHLVAGDAGYLDDVLNGLVPLHMLALSNYPNPFVNSTLIRYALPESFGKVEFRLKVHDSRGRLVWAKTLRGSNSLSYLWDGRDNGGKIVGAGFYSLALEALTPGKSPQRAVRRILKY